MAVIWLPGNEPTGPVGEINPKGTTGRRGPITERKIGHIKDDKNRPRTPKYQSDVECQILTVRVKIKLLRKGENASLETSVLMLWGQDQASRLQMKEEPPGASCRHPHSLELM